MRDLGRLTPPTERIVITITQVDLDQRIAHCTDKTKAPVLVSFRQVDGAAFRIPMQGENWTAQRYGYQWFLDQRLDSQDEHSDLTALQPGDTRVHADGTVHLVGQGVQINNQPVGATVHEVFTTNGILLSFTLSAAPVGTQTMHVYVNGAIQVPSGWSLANKTITFLAAPVTGTLIVYYQRV